MKRIFLLFLLGVCFIETKSQVVDTLKLKCRYRLFYVRDTLSPQVKRMDEMNLEIGNRVTRFYSAISARADSALASAKEENPLGVVTWNMKATGSIRATDHTYVLYSGYPEGKMTYTDKIGTDNYQYEEPIPVISWKILPDTMTFLSFPCRKAVGRFRGRIYTVWFTPALPVPAGPWKLGGLPGLILKAEDDRQHYCFECLSIANARETMVWKNKKYIFTDRKEFNRTFCYYKENPLALLKKMGIEVALQKEGSLSSIPKKRYNPIELSDE